MKALFNALKKLYQDTIINKPSEEIYMVLGRTRYDFTAHPGGIFTIRQDGSGLTSPDFPLNYSGFERGMTWIAVEDQNRLAALDARKEVES